MYAGGPLGRESHKPVKKPTTAIDREDPAYAGQKHYGPAFLRIYDRVVLGFYGRVVWRCPTPRLVAHYERNLGLRHLDVGPGTGYFLRQATLPAEAAITLVDPNPNVLDHASRRLADKQVKAVEADVFQPLEGLGPFDSIGLNYVLHCLPGPMTRKAQAIRNLADVLGSTGTLFGASILATPHLHTAVSRRVLWFLNRQGIFGNLGDDEAALSEALRSSFDTVHLEIVGSVAVFQAKNPRAHVRDLSGGLPSTTS